MSKPASISAELPFETAMGELEQIVRQLEAGQGSLSDAIASYERGTALQQHCAKLLNEAELKIQQVAQGADGKLSLQPYGTEDSQ